MISIDFQTWPQIGCQQSNQPIRNNVRKYPDKFCSENANIMKTVDDGPMSQIMAMEVEPMWVCLWRHTNARHRYSGVIYVYFFWTHKLALIYVYILIRLRKGLFLGLYLNNIFVMNAMIIVSQILRIESVQWLVCFFVWRSAWRNILSAISVWSVVSHVGVMYSFNCTIEHFCILNSFMHW